MEVLLVHRPLRNDWTLPIGGLEPGETLRDCALREVREETGYTCDLGRFLSTLEVVGEEDALTHRFHLFAMTPVGGKFRANAETDRIDWLTIPAAVERASYPNVRELLLSFDPGQM